MVFEPSIWEIPRETPPGSDGNVEAVGPGNTTQRRYRRHITSIRTSHLYLIVSLFVAILAVITSSGQQKPAPTKQDVVSSVSVGVDEIMKTRNVNAKTNSIGTKGISGDGMNDIDEILDSSICSPDFEEGAGLVSEENDESKTTVHVVDCSDESCNNNKNCNGSTEEECMKLVEDEPTEDLSSPPIISKNEQVKNSHDQDHQSQNNNHRPVIDTVRNLLESFSSKQHSLKHEKPLLRFIEPMTNKMRDKLLNLLRYPDEEEEEKMKKELPNDDNINSDSSTDQSESSKKSKNSISGTSLSSAFLSFLRSMIDPSILDPVDGGGASQILNKILSSTPRLLAVANLLLAVTYLLHSVVADLFLSNNGNGNHNEPAWNGVAENNNINPNNNGMGDVDQRYLRAGRERLGGFLVFKLLLISAVVEPDTSDLLILLSWYTLLSFLRSLAHLAASTTNHTSQSGLPPRRNVMNLLLLVLLCDFTAAAACVAMFGGAGLAYVLLLVCDCALLALDVVVHLSRHATQVLEDRHSRALTGIEDEQIRLHQTHNEQRRRTSGENRANASTTVSSSSENNSDDNVVETSDTSTAPTTRTATASTTAFFQQSRDFDRQIEVLENAHAKRLSILDSTVFVLELMSALLTTCHFLHIWSLHGLTCGLVDGVLALHLHTAISAAMKKIADRRNIYRISRDLDGMFEDASDIDLRKASATGDVCCICLGTMSVGSVKKVACGHLYHSHCLREVIERARSIEAARCPLCRSSILHGLTQSTPSGNNNNTNNNNNNNNLNPVNNNNNNNLNNTNNIVVDDIAAEVRAELDINNAAARQGLQQQPNEHALFRFSTEGILPSWLPLPAFSFEVVRRPPMTMDTFDAPANNNMNNNVAAAGNGAGAVNTQAGFNNNTNNNDRQELQQQQQQQQAENNNNGRNQSFWRRLLLFAGVVPMSQEEEAEALAQLVDMFPQYERADLLRELRERYSAEAVVESILLGIFNGVPRGNTDDIPPNRRRENDEQEERRRRQQRQQQLQNNVASYATGDVGADREEGKLDTSSRYYSYYFVQ